MKLNSETKIIGFKTVLVPYRISHVEKYHKWMESEELLDLTASMRLSLDAEYTMQQTWLNDEDKCTFIVLDRITMDKTENEVESMIGDVNLYLSKDESKHLCSLMLVGEISLMVAEVGFRNAGRGKETALHMLRYGVEKLGVKKFIAVISLDNLNSINLFLKLKFNKETENKVFNEMTLSRDVDEEWTSWLIDNSPSYEIGVTEPNK